MRLLKYFISVVVFLMAVVFAHSAYAWDNRWEIQRESSNNSAFGTDIEMRKKYDYDPSNKFRGTIENDGSTRMRDYNGNALRGNIDNDGYGRLRDQDGNTYRVRPR
jgi:hypothetical protein